MSCKIWIHTWCWISHRNFPNLLFVLIEHIFSIMTKIVLKMPCNVWAHISLIGQRLSREVVVRIEPTCFVFWQKFPKKFPVSLEPMNFSNSDRSFAGGCLSELNPYLLCEFWKKLPRKSPARIESILFLNSDSSFPGLSCQNWAQTFFEFWQKLSRKFPVRIEPRILFWILTETFQEISCQNYLFWGPFWQEISKKVSVRIA